MLERPSGVQQQVRQIINLPKNKQKINDLILKMGRVLSKKRQLHQQQPVLAYENRIWIGNFSFANNKQFLAKNNIKHVLSCLQLSLTYYSPDISYQQFIVKDCQDSNFAKMVDDFRKILTQSNGNVFVHCFSGISRSAAFLIAYIMMKQKNTYNNVLEKLRSIYPLAKPNHYFEEYLRQTEQSILKKTDNPNFDLLGHEQKPLNENLPQVRQQVRKQEDLLNIMSEVPKSPQKEESINLLEHSSDLKVQQKPFSPIKSPLKNQKQQINLLQDFKLKNQARNDQNLIDIEIKQQNKNETTKQEQSTSFSLQESINLLSLQNQTQFKSKSHIENDQQINKLLQKHQDLIELQSQPIVVKKQNETEHQQQKPEDENHQVTNQQQEQKFIEKANFNQKKRKPKKKK